MPARRVRSSRRDTKAQPTPPGVLRGTLEQLDDRLAPAVFTATVDPGQFGQNNTAAVNEIVGFFNTAKANNEPDVINLYRPTAYAGPATYSFTAAQDGANAIAEFVTDGTGRNGVTVNGNGAILSRPGAAPAFRFFSVNGTNAQTYLTINDLTLTGGAQTTGGAVLANGGAQLTVNNTSIAGNIATAGSGGGVSLTGGSSATLNTVSLTSNTATSGGGGLNNTGTGAFVQFNNSLISGNTSAAGAGGVAATAGSFEFNDSTLSNNTGTTGGAANVTDAVYNRDTIINNTSSAVGTGGVSGTNVRVVQSYIAGNQGQTAASNGGGVSGTTVSVVNSTIDSNTTAGGSAAGGVSGTNVTVLNSTVTRNATGGTKAGGVQAGTLALTGTIVANNTNGGSFLTAEVQRTGSNTGGYNFIRASDLANYTQQTGDKLSTDADAKNALNPLLGNPQANGGPVLTRALGAGSPAIDVGNPTQTSSTDGRGFSRVVGVRADIGAFEVQTGNSVGLLAGDNQTAQTNQTFTTPLQVLVTDPNGNPVSGVIARFQAPTTPNPTASAIFFGQGPTTGVVTNGQGKATVPVAANAIPGSYVVTANTGNGPVGATFDLRNTAFGNVTAPAGSVIQVFSGNNQSTTANAQFANNLVVQILDTAGNGINNVPVTLTAPSVPGQASLTFANGGTTITVNTSTLTVVNPSTGVSSQVAGLVSLPVNANTVASITPYLVEASAENAGTINFSLTNVPAAASKVTILSGSGQATLTSTAFSNPLQAQVTDVFGNPVLANVPVTFRGPSSGPGVTFTSSNFTTVNTDTNGIASALPTANDQGGSYFVDATVTNGTQTASFGLSNIFVPPPTTPPPTPNANPIITDVPNQTLVNGQSGTYSFGIADAETAPSNLVLAAMSSDSTLIPAITFGGSGINRTVTVTTAAGLTGTATITLTVTDEGGKSATDTFDVTVTPVPPVPPPPPDPSNTPPVISDIADETIQSGQSASTPFVVVDGQTPAAGLVVTATAANTTLIPAVTVTGTGSNRVVNVFTAGGQSGTTVVTVTVSDTDGNATSDTFTVTVPPTTIPPIPPPATPTVPLVGTPQFAVGSGTNGAQVVRYFNADHTERFITSVFPGLTGGVRTAAGDFNGDGVADVVVGTGPGSASQVQVLNGNDGTVLFSLQPFEASFTGGIYVSAGDLTGDGVADLVITPDEGGGPRARILNGSGFSTIADFFVIDDPNFRGGARAAIGDVNGDGRSDLIASAGFGGGPRIAGYDGTSLTSSPRKLFSDFFLFESSLRNGAFITVGDINGDGFADIIGGGGPGGAPRVFALSGQTLLSNLYSPLANFFAGPTSDRGGVRVAVKNLDNDNKADVIVGSGDGSGSTVVGYLGSGISPAGAPLTAFNLDAYPGFAGGVYVG